MYSHCLAYAIGPSDWRLITSQATVRPDESPFPVDSESFPDEREHGRKEANLG